MKEKSIINSYEYAREIYAEVGVDTEKAIEKIRQVPISMHCWQGDDLIGFDCNNELSGGIAATGNYPGRPNNIKDLRADIQKAISLIPGKKKLNLHASYAELGGKKIGRDQYTVELFEGWIDWANALDLGMDFNPTFFSHPMMDGDFSLSSPRPEVRRYWIEHGKRCREISREIGRRTGKVCVNNFWMPDGYKDNPADTRAPRERMLASLDEIFSMEMEREYMLDAVESKLFGFGIESYTVANHEFSLAYALERQKVYCLDMGHFHPTEQISAKISSLMCFLENLLIHVSRGVRWDSDHVVVLDDELHNVMQEIVRGDYLDRVFIAQDYFDASINRIAAWVIAMRNTQKALLSALMEPQHARKAEEKGDYTARLAYLEESKTLPFTPVWDYYCQLEDVPAGADWLNEVKDYEKMILSR